jgi:decaprenylphospho-beta-D-erythro-pentofuranosid-2-ulose 2-reductase
VVLFGGTSEIGLAIAKEAESGLEYSTERRIVRVLRAKVQNEAPAVYQDEVWEPSSSVEVLETVNRLAIGQSDLVVISIGDLSLEAYSLEELADSITKIEANLFSNGTLPALTLLAVLNKMVTAGGGAIVVVSSVAAFPVLDSNSIYAAGKRMLDEIAQSMLPDLRKSNVKIVIVRPGFVATKLHRERTKSFLSTSIEKIAKVVAGTLGRGFSGVIWIPRAWAPVSWVLSSIPFTRIAASAVLRRLRRSVK